MVAILLAIAIVHHTTHNHTAHLLLSSLTHTVSEALLCSAPLHYQEPEAGLEADGRMSAAAFGTQGITTILSSDCHNPKAASLRRTPSADMSSRKWIVQDGLVFSSEKHRPDDMADSSMASAEEGGVSGSKSQFDIWNSIQEEKNRIEVKETRPFDTWSAILSQKTDQPVPAAPYIHPLARKSARSLSEKSLEVCTESLGSETGSDGFSSYPASEASEEEEEDKEEFTGQTERALPSSSTSIDKRRNRQPLARSSSFPPPLPSLSRQNGASLHVRSRRDNGRLVLEAVSVKEQNNFRAQREDGRLVLTFIDDPSNDHDYSGDENDWEETDDGFADAGAIDDEEDGHTQAGDMETEETGDAGEKMELLVEELPKPFSREECVDKLAILRNNPLILANGNPVRSNRFGEVVIFNNMEKDTIKMQESFPRLPGLSQAIDKQSTVTAISYGNTHKYLWRAESTALTDLSAEQSIFVEGYCKDNYIISKEEPVTGERQELMVLRGDSADYLVPLIQSCKDTRRSVWFLRPRCIATS